MLTQRDIDELESTFKGVFATKEELQQMKSDLLDKLDSILKEILASREEQTVVAHQVSSLEDRVSKMEIVKTG